MIIIFNSSPNRPHWFSIILSQNCILLIWKCFFNLQKHRKYHHYSVPLCLYVVHRNRVGGSGSQTRAKSPSPAKVTDVRQLLEEKRQGLSQHRQPPPVATGGKTGLHFKHLSLFLLILFMWLTDCVVGRRAAAVGEKALLSWQTALPLPRLPQRNASSQRANQRRASQTGRGQSRQQRLLQFIQRQEDKYAEKLIT